MGNSTNTSSQLMKLETLLCAKLFWRIEVPAKKFSRIPGPSRPMQLSIWKKSLNVIFVTGTSPLKPTEKCTLEGITKIKMMKPNISVNSVGKHLTWNLSSITTGTCTGYSIIGCFKLRKRKRQQGRPKKRLVNKENPVLPKVVLQAVSLHLKLNLNCLNLKYLNLKCLNLNFLNLHYLKFQTLNLH